MTQTKLLMSAGVLSSLLLAGCGSSSGGGALSAAGFEPSLTQVPAELREPVKAAKTYDVAGYLDPGETIEKFTVDGKDALGGYDFSALPVGFSTKPYEMHYTDNGVPGTEKGDLQIYNQAYSVVFGALLKEEDGSSVTPSDTIFDEWDVLGLYTEKSAVDALVAEGVKATYTGAAFTPKEQGALSYTVDFGKQKGSGSITGIVATGNITLEEAGLMTVGMGEGIVGNATLENPVPGASTSKYALSLYGPKAEEIAGLLWHHGAQYDDGIEVIFAGKR